MRKLKLFSLLAALTCTATMWATTYSSGTVAISDLEPYDCLQEGVTLTGSDGYTLRFSNYKKNGSSAADAGVSFGSSVSASIGAGAELNLSGDSYTPANTGNGGCAWIVNDLDGDGITIYGGAIYSGVTMALQELNQYDVLTGEITLTTDNTDDKIIFALATHKINGVVSNDDSQVTFSDLSTTTLSAGAVFTDKSSNTYKPCTFSGDDGNAWMVMGIGSMGTGTGYGLLGLEIAAAAPATPATVSGNCGPFNTETNQFADNLQWEYNPTTKTLTITGSGAMDDFAPYDNYGANIAPWTEYLFDMEHVVLPEGLTNISCYSFWSNDGGMMTKLTSITIPSTVTSIDHDAFAASGLTAVTFATPSQLTTIGNSAFNSCENLTTITLPASVTSIDEMAFTYTGLTSITLSESLTTIGQRAFWDCSSLESITIPASVTDIEAGAFKDAGLTEVTFLGTTPPALKTIVVSEKTYYAFDVKNPKINACVPVGSVATYEAATHYATIFNISDCSGAPTPSTPETSDNVDGIEDAMEALVTAGGTTDLIINRELFKDGCFNTLCLPFSLNASELAASPLAGCKLYSLSNAYYEGERLDLTITEETAIEAGMPYLIKWNYGDKITSMTFTGVTVTASTGSTVEKGGVRFVGTIGRSTLPHGDANYLFLGANDNLYYSDDSDGTSMKGFRAYFIVDNVSGEAPRQAPARLVIAPKMPTAVENVQGDVQSTKVIENGQLYIIKNGVKYNAQGKVVK